jgi:hypothetical protein
MTDRPNIDAPGGQDSISRATVMSRTGPSEKLASIDAVAAAQLRLPESKIHIVGCGGAGINLVRHFRGQPNVESISYVDTSDKNVHDDEVDLLTVVAGGDGAGGNRAAVGGSVERSVTLDYTPHPSDVTIVVFSTAGGSGSIIGPMILRQHRRLNRLVVGVAITDISSANAARNTKNTLQTLTNIAKNNDYEIPMIVVSNELAGGRVAADRAGVTAISNLVELLTRPVYEVDLSDRRNWLSPYGVIGSHPGIKLISVLVVDGPTPPTGVIEVSAGQMVDSTLVLANAHGTYESHPLLKVPPRLIKCGLNRASGTTIIGRVSSDISGVEVILDQIDRLANATKAQSHGTLSRLSDTSGDDAVY